MGSCCCFLCFVFFFFFVCLLRVVLVLLCWFRFVLLLSCWCCFCVLVVFFGGVVFRLGLLCLLRVLCCVVFAFKQQMCVCICWVCVFFLLVGQLSGSCQKEGSKGFRGCFGSLF